MNRVIISGRWTKDNEIRYNQAGTAILSNTIASNRKVKNKDGKYDSDFINVVLFNQSAKFAADYSNKGDMVLIEGRLQSRSYDDKDGKKVYVTEILADSIELLNAKKKEETPKEEPVKEEDPFKITDSDLPF